MLVRENSRFWLIDHKGQTYSFDKSIFSSYDALKTMEVSFRN